MDRRRLGGFVATIAVLALACGDPVPSGSPPAATAIPTATASPTPEPTPEPTLTVALEGGLVGGLSNAADGAATRRAAGFLFDGLYALDGSLAPVPVLAQGPPVVAADGLTWTVRLRGGVRFHDGSPLDADDVVQTYAIAQQTACAFDQTLCLATVLESVAAVDPGTVSFTLDRKLAAFATTFLDRFIESKDAVDASYQRFRDGASAVTPDQLTAFLDAVAAEEARPGGPDGADGLPTPDYARFREDGEALLTAATVDLPDPAQFVTADGAPDESAYVREVVARVRAIDAGVTGDAIDGLAAAYPYLDIQRAPVGTGPFRFDAFREGDALEFVANDDYFRGPPAIRRIVLPIIPDAGDRARALADGTIDWDPALDAAGHEALRGESEVRFAEYPDLGFLGLYFNLNPEANGLFVDRDLRQALAYCFDEEAAVEAATGGDGQAIYSEIPAGSWAHPTEGLNTYPLDRARATALIEAAGWSLGDDGIYERGDRRLSTVVAVRTGFPSRSAWMTSLRDQVRACGIDIGFEEVSYESILAMLDVYPHVNAAAPGSGRPFDAYFGGVVEPIDPDPFRLYHSSECSTAERPATFNFICFQDPAIDALIAAGQVEFDLARRAAIYHEYAVRLSNELPVLYAWSDTIREGVRTSVDTTAPGGLRLDSRAWYRPLEQLTREP